MSDENDSEFAGLMPGVKRMRQDRINVYAHRGHKKFTPRGRIAEGDKPADFGFDEAPARDSFFATGLQRKLQRKIRQGQVPAEASLDLHGYRQKDAIRALESFLEDATRARLRSLIVIHGQGYRSQSDAVLRPLVYRWLADRPEVLAWCPAQPRDGAAGASYVYLRG